MLCQQLKVVYKLTFSGHCYKEKFIFYIHSINDIYNLYYRLHTSFNK